MHLVRLSEAALRRILSSVVMTFLFAIIVVQIAGAAASPTYDIGTPTLRDIWVDPVNGNDGNSGATRSQALKTLYQAWNSIPMSQTLSATGYRLMLVAGTYPQTVSYWQSRWGTAQFPIIIQSADGNGAAVITDMMNVYDCRYLYLIGIKVTATAGDVIHLDHCSHVLVRQVQLVGIGAYTNYGGPKEDLKVNQTQYIYVEDSDMSIAYGTALDFVAVQYGHVVRNKLHDAGGWCVYVKGGSAGIQIEGNEIYNCAEVGFTAGQGTGFEFMVSPWIHYEAYDLKIVNNVIHDTSGPGLAVLGGYNILVAHNTLYRVGSLSHALDISHGDRGCDGWAPATCASNLAAGGWGSTGAHAAYVPARNVYIYNNIIYNPPGYQSQWQHLSVEPAITAPSGTNVPSPAAVDTNLQIRGNIFWNGPASLPIGVEATNRGCQPGNPTCSLTQLQADNAFNTLQPQLVDPAHGNFRPVSGGNVFSARTFAIPDYAGGDLPKPPQAPQGNLVNTVAQDADGNGRNAPSTPGAYTTPGAPPSLAATVALAASPASQTVTAGGSATYAISLTRTNFTGNTTLSVTGLPAGATASFSPASAAASSTLTVVTPSGAVAGAYALSIAGVASGATVAGTTVTLSVAATASSIVTLAGSPGALTVSRGQSATYAIALTRTNCSIPVTLAVSGLPQGDTATFGQNPVTGSSTTLTVTTSSASAAGTGAISVTGAATGATVKPASVGLTVTSATPAVLLSATPAAQTVVRAMSIGYTVSINRANVTGPVTLAVSGLPLNSTASFSSNPTSDASVVLTISTTKTSPPGTSRLTITGTASGATVAPATTDLTVSLISVSVPQTQTGNLTSTDETDPNASSAYKDDYMLTGVSAGQRVQVDLQSSFDSFLRVFNMATGKCVAEDDDGSGATNARLTFTVQPGVTYMIRVSSFSGGQLGPYTLITSAGKAARDSLAQ